MAGADLHGAHLVGADLDGANLVQANLRGARLQAANLRDANLQGSTLGGANLTALARADAPLGAGLVVALGDVDGDGYADAALDGRTLAANAVSHRRQGDGHLGRSDGDA